MFHTFAKFKLQGYGLEQGLVGTHAPAQRAQFSVQRPSVCVRVCVCSNVLPDSSCTGRQHEGATERVAAAGRAGAAAASAPHRLPRLLLALPPPRQPPQGLLRQSELQFLSRNDLSL